MATVRPVPRIASESCLLRINSAVAPRGAESSILPHPGSEAFLVLTGQLTRNTACGKHVVKAGGTRPGAPHQTMQSTGDAGLRLLVMFLLDAAATGPPAEMW